MIRNGTARASKPGFGINRMEPTGPAPARAEEDSRRLTYLTFAPARLSASRAQRPKQSHQQPAVVGKRLPVWSKESVPHWVSLVSCALIGTASTV